MKGLLLWLVIALLLVSCESLNPDEPERIAVGSDITRFIDEEAGVVCWIYTGYNKGGISCLPIKDTALGDRP